MTDKAVFLKTLQDRGDWFDLDLIDRAFEFSARAHRGQYRVSGDPFITHCVEVALILADLNLDSVTVACGLIHDVVEDTPTTLEEVREAFGDEMATIVDGLTKIAGLAFRSLAEKQAENYRKLILSLAKDVRIMVIKFADRLHNMRTIEHLPEDNQRRTARETLDIYAPLAHRLGMARISWELEDLAFKVLEPEAYRGLVRKVARKRKERESMIEAIKRPLSEELKKAGIEAEITGRPKHLYSIQRKMVNGNKSFDEIYDLMAVRVLVDTERDCYHTLGNIHTLWTPLQDRFKDYIATPKSNMYQSLHTTVFGPKGQLYEVQIRTWAMQRTAEYGIAAHWKYKEEVEEETELESKLEWLRHVLEWQRDMTDPREFMEYLRIDLFRDEIFVFTPKGDVHQLPGGSTPIDFAFSVHTEIGLHCAGAQVNGRMVPLSRPLRSGETVEILTSSNQRPSRDWLAFVKTSRARSAIRRWLREQELADSTALGKEILAKELKRNRQRRPSDEEILAVAQRLNLRSAEQLFAALGRGDLSVGRVWASLFPGTDRSPREAPSAFERLVERVKGSSRAVRIQGLSNLMVKYSQCCQPVPGDEVVGYVTRGRGISIHRRDCPNLLRLDSSPERRVEIDWKGAGGEQFMVRLVVRGTDRQGLFADLAGSVSGTSTNIRSANLSATDGGMEGIFVVEVDGLAHLTKVMEAMKRVKGILSVERKEYLSKEELKI